MLPKSILEEVGRIIYPRKTASYKEIRNRFALHSYGPKKIDKWLEYYERCEIIKDEGDDQYSCILW